MVPRDMMNWLRLKPGAPLYARIWYIMHYRNMSCTELAKRLNMARITICQWTDGIYQPSPRNFFRLAEVLGVNYEWLAGQTEELDLDESLH